MIQYLYLGRRSYSEGFAIQEELVSLRQQQRIDNTLLLLEHPSVLTLGRNANRSNVLASSALLAARGITVHETNRGGDVTYHGPGQLVGYPIFNLRSLRTPQGERPGPVDFVRQMEEALIRLCGMYGVTSSRICGLTGVWCGACGVLLGDGCGGKASDLPQGERKIAAIGIHVSRSVTSHGFAFNLAPDLRDFQLIIPCGITNRTVTSLEREISAPARLPSLEALADEAARQFGFVFGEQVLALESLEALRARTARIPLQEPSAPQFPAEDTPLRVPPEIERLHKPKNRPLNV